MHDPLPVLVTGASGLLGSHLIRALSPAAQVHALVRAVPLDPSPSVDYRFADFSGTWDPIVLPESADTIIHLAQSRRFREFPEQALDVFRVNVASTATLLDYAVSVGARRFIYASSGGVYGSRTQAMSENTPINTPGRLGHYLGSKLSGELLVQAYASQMTVVVLRFFFMYGSGQSREMLIPRLLSNVTHSRKITLQGPDGLRMNPVHVSDACEAVIAAMAMAESATINVAGPEVLSLRAIGEIMGRHLGRDAVFEVLPEPPNDLIGDIQLMRSVLHDPVVRLADRLHEIEAES